MGDEVGLPAWRRAVGFAHTACAVAEGVPVTDSEVRHRFRRAAVSVPSLLAEAFLETASRESGELLLLAGGRLEEIEGFLTAGPIGASLPEEDRSALLDDLAALREEILTLSIAAGRGPAEPG